jgi:predicted ATPase
LLNAISPLEEQELQQGLARLVEAELLYQRGLPPIATYVFKHTLIHEAANESLLKSRRQRFHPQIARALVERFPETVETQPELVAHHYTEAPLNEPAIDYWQRAGRRALERSANVEVIHHLTKGLEMIEKLSESADKNQKELALRIPLSMGLVATQGYGAVEVKRTFARARELRQRLGDARQLFPALYGLWLFYVVRAERDNALRTANELLRLARQTNDPALLVHGHHAVGASLTLDGMDAKEVINYVGHRRRQIHMQVVQTRQRYYLQVAQQSRPFAYCHIAGAEALFA